MSLYDKDNEQHLVYRDYWAARSAEYSALPKWTVKLCGFKTVTFKVRAKTIEAAEKLGIACQPGFPYQTVVVYSGWDETPEKETAQ